MSDHPVVAGLLDYPVHLAEVPTEYRQVVLDAKTVLRASVSGAVNGTEVPG